MRFTETSEDQEFSTKFRNTCFYKIPVFVETRVSEFCVQNSETRTVILQNSETRTVFSPAITYRLLPLIVLQ